MKLEGKTHSHPLRVLRRGTAKVRRRKILMGKVSIQVKKSVRAVTCPGQQGHYFDVNCLAYSPDSQLLATGAEDNKVKAILASSSWDKTVRWWGVFEGKGSVEPFPHTHDVLTVVYRPDGKQLACSTLDGHIHLWDPINGDLMYTIEGRRDIAGGRHMTDRRSAANSSLGRCFTTLCYSADGSYILAGGSSKYICMYDVTDQLIAGTEGLLRLEISNNSCNRTGSHGNADNQASKAQNL
ncbi:hypothetical protein Q3G72_017347 [Acer saccharum]|nr:hypothetical protein Q3G72_017347 [Acer saccharum]